jgi:hypothetical protein
MSGPVRGQELFNDWGGVDWDKSKVADLRMLADDVQKGKLIGSEELPNDEIAGWLYQRADAIEAALEQIEEQTSGGYDDLVRAIQYNRTGDYGSRQVAEAWEGVTKKE